MEGRRAHSVFARCDAPPGLKPELQWLLGVVKIVPVVSGLLYSQLEQMSALVR
jgi:hypothetical protein